MPDNPTIGAADCYVAGHSSPRRSLSGHPTPPRRPERPATARGTAPAHRGGVGMAGKGAQTPAMRAKATPRPPFHSFAIETRPCALWRVCGHVFRCWPLRPAPGRRRPGRRYYPGKAVVHPAGIGSRYEHRWASCAAARTSKDDFTSIPPARLLASDSNIRYLLIKQQ